MGSSVARVSAPRRGRIGAAAAGMVILLLASPAHAEPAAESGHAPGATLDGLLALAHRLSPTLAARALEVDAAAARVRAAGALDDPTLRITSDEDRGSHGQRLNKMIYGVEQEFPLWGKRELRRRVAEAEADSVRAQERVAALELDARIRVAFAQFYQASRSLEIEDGVHALLHTVAQAAQTRYAQGLGTQSDAIRAEVERSRISLERERLTRDRRMAEARLNGLLARPADAPFAEPEALPAVPPAEQLAADRLLERARQHSPLVVGADAEIAAAEGGRQLVAKSWYPDISLGAAAIQREAGPDGYMLSAGLRLPLQWGLRDAQAHEAAAKLEAAQKRRDASLLDLQGTLGETLAELEAARRTENVVTADLAPQTTAAYRSALVAYQSGRGDLTAVLEAAHHVQEVRLERLAAQVDQQTALAEIVRTVGGEL